MAQSDACANVNGDRVACAEECRFDVAGKTIAARRWRNGARPVLALHGWLDNAASFDALAPRLRDADVVAIDLAGHGHSYHRPPQASYNIWDDLPDILRVADQLGWHRFHLVGHSRGAIISALLTAALPERIASVVFLDGIVPPPVPVEETFVQLGQFLRQHLAPPRPQVRYTDKERALQVRCRVAGMTVESARPIVERGMREVDGTFQWRADPRLQLASAFKLNPAHNTVLIEKLARYPALLLLAESGWGRQMQADGELDRLQGIQRHMLPGDHHFHLDAAHAASIADCIDAFWQAVPAHDFADSSRFEV